MKRLASLLLSFIAMSAYGQDDGATYPIDGGAVLGAKATKWVAIKTSNAVKVASEVAITVQGISDSGDGLGILSTDSAAAARIGFKDFLKKQLHFFNRLATGQAAGLDFSISSTYRETIPCDEGGSASAEWIDADNNRDLSQGDTCTIFFNQCKMEGDTYNGRIKIKVLIGQGRWVDEIPSYKFKLAFNMSSLSIRGIHMIPGSGTDVVDGDITWTNYSSNGVNYFENFTGKSLKIKSTGPHRGVRSVTNYEVKSTTNDNTRIFSVAGKGVLNSTVLGGSVSFTTLKNFKGIGDDYPYEGIMKITGANKSNEKISTVDHRNVRLPVDANGDGVAEQTLTTTWSKLLK